MHQGMRMFNLMCCQLCQTSPATHYSVCQDCWQQLPWLKQSIKRQDIEIMVACEYSYPLDRIIQQFKYQQKLHLHSLLAGLLQQLKYPKKLQAIVPMPISTTRLIERGYNQSMLLAQHLSKVLQIPIWQPIIRLEHHHQKGLTRSERLSHIQHQFVAQPSRVCYRHVLMVDDVVTTGASLSALSKHLQDLGCQHIYAACLAAAQYGST